MTLTSRWAPDRSQPRSGRFAPARPATLRPMRLLLAAVLTMGVALPAFAEDTPPAEARAPVEALYAALLATMKAGESVSLEARRERLGPTIDAAYDVGFMAAKALGRYGRTLSSEQRAEWTHTFRDLTVNTYATRFAEFSGQEFAVDDVMPSARGTFLVLTRILSPGSEPVEIRYRVRADAEGVFRIIDVFLNGTVSELALRRSEYSSVIKSDGYEALQDGLREKIAATPQP